MSAKRIRSYGVLILFRLALFFLGDCTKPITSGLVKAHRYIGRDYFATIEIAYGDGFGFRVSIVLS